MSAIGGGGEERREGGREGGERSNRQTEINSVPILYGQQGSFPCLAQCCRMVGRITAEFQRWIRTFMWLLARSLLRDDRLLLNVQSQFKTLPKPQFNQVQ